MEHLRALYQEKSFRRLLLSSWILLTLSVFVSLVLASASKTDALPAKTLSKKCTTTNANIKISGNKAIGTFTVPQSCPGTHVVFASYKAPNGTDGKPFADQVLFASNSSKFGPGNHQISVALPDCYYQVDLARGTLLQNFKRTTYNTSADHILLTARHGGSKSCDQKPPVAPQEPTSPAEPIKPEEPKPVPPAETSPTPPQQNITMIQNQSQSQNSTNIVNASTPVVTSPQKQSDEYTPTAQPVTPAGGSLPETGASAGSIVATFFGVSTLSTTLYYVVTARLFG